MTSFKLPETRYASSGDFSIAYQVLGNRCIDLILVPGLFSHIDFLHELPGYTTFLRRLSNFSRVVTFDKRGQGLSDKIDGAPSLEERMDDVRAIMEAIGSSTPSRRAMFQTCGVFAEFERGTIREPGLARARQKGTKLGRRKVKPSVAAWIRELRAKGDGILKIGRTLGVGTSVVQRSS